MTKSKIKIHRALIAAVLAAVARPLCADTTWHAGSDIWETPANWSNGLPGSSSDAYIDNGGTVQITSSNTAADIWVGAGASHSGVLNLPAGTLSVRGNELVGYYGAGTIIQSGGFNTFGASSLLYPYLLLGQVAGTGVYNLSGSATLAGPYSEYIGYSGTGIFNQFGGLNSAGTGIAGYPVDMYIGSQPTGVGVYNLSAGNLTLREQEYIGDYGHGTFNQTGGTHSNTSQSVGRLYLGNVHSDTFSMHVYFGVGVYSLSAGQLNFALSETVGNGGTGYFYQSGGMNSAGSNPTASNGLSIGQGGLYNLTDGTLAVTGQLTVAGTFAQSGGYHTVTGSAVIDATPGFWGVSGPCSYLLSGTGVLSATNETIGKSYSGTFAQTGGTNTVAGNLTLADGSASTGLYSLSGAGALVVSGTEYVSNWGAGTFNQTGGSHTIGTPLSPQNLYLAYFGGSTGTYTLNGANALFTVNGNAYIGAKGIGTLNIQAGTMIVTNTLKTNFYDANFPSSVNISGGTLSVGNLVELSPGSWLNISGTGVLDLTTGDLVRHSSPASLPADFTTLRNYLTGNQIRSSSASSTTGLGLMKSADYFALHPGQPFNGFNGPNDIYIKYTYLGDADFSGKIDLNDYALLESAFLFGNFDPITNPASWVNGDFNNDGKIDMTDFALIDNAFQNQSGTLANDEINTHVTQFGTPYLTALASLNATIPEPSSLAILLLAAPALLRRRKSLLV